MTQHVYARLSGFGLTVTPRAPFRISRTADGQPSIDVQHQSTQGPLFARLIPDNGGYRSKLDRHTNSLFDVLDVEAGNAEETWTIETSAYCCAWPSGYEIVSNRFPQDPSLFDLLGPEREMIYVQHPQAVPDVAEMCAPGQSIIDVQRSAHTDSVTLCYDHQGSSWWQRHEVLRWDERTIAVTAQAPWAAQSDAELAVRQLVASLRPYPAEGG